jgi:hypothetical protein
VFGKIIGRWSGHRDIKNKTFALIREFTPNRWELLAVFGSLGLTRTPYHNPHTQKTPVTVGDKGALFVSVCVCVCWRPTPQGPLALALP